MRDRLHPRYKYLLWLDAAGLSLFAATGAERALAVGANAAVAVIMSIITACFCGIIRDTLSQEKLIIIPYEIYLTAALIAAATFVILNAFGFGQEKAVSGAFLFGSVLRGGQSSLAGLCPVIRRESNSWFHPA